MKGRGLIGIGVAACFAIGFAILVVVVTKGETPKRERLTSAEYRWTGAYSGWRGRVRAVFSRAYEASTGSTELAQLKGPFRPLTGCGATYARQVGSAPPRLDPVQISVLKACREAVAAVRQLQVYPYVSDPRRSRHVIFGMRALEEADQELLNRLPLDKPLPRLGGRTSRSRIEPRFSAAAGEATGYDADARCWSRSDWAEVQREIHALGRALWTRYLGGASASGYALSTQLSPSTCATLAALAYGASTPPPRRAVEALVALGREAERVAGESDASDATCYALQDVRRLAVELGEPRVEANRLAALSWRLYASGRLLPGQHSPRCRNGGELDKNAALVWP